MQVDDGFHGSLATCFPPGYDPLSLHIEDSGKLLVLSHLLHYLISTTREKVVLVSNYTQVRKCDNNAVAKLRAGGATIGMTRISLVCPLSFMLAYIILSNTGERGCTIDY